MRCSTSSAAAFKAASNRATLRSCRWGRRCLDGLRSMGLLGPMLEEVFHLSGGMDIIANSIPGSSRREMTVNCYLLTGIRGLLISDVPVIEESEAIAVCKRMNNFARARQS
jgi:hypothetical protein